MKVIRVFFLASGIFLLGLGLYFSSVQYNAAEPFGTVQGFTYGCITQDSDFVDVYGSWNNPDFCLHNAGLAAIVYGMIGSGIFLIVKNYNKIIQRPTSFFTVRYKIIIIIGIVVLSIFGYQELYHHGPRMSDYPIWDELDITIQCQNYHLFKDPSGCKFLDNTGQQITMKTIQELQEIHGNAILGDLCYYSGEGGYITPCGKP